VHPVGSYCTDFPENLSENIVQCSNVAVQYGLPRKLVWKYCAVF